MKIPGITWVETDADLGEGPCLRLLCPSCSFSYQHHEAVREFVRLGGEDGASMVGVPGIAEWVPNENNPSWRRGAVVIDFWGECGHCWQLEIVQHKGETFMFARESAASRRARIATELRA